MWNPTVVQFLVSVAIFFGPLSGYRVELELQIFEQHYGHEVVNSSGLRVRKFNRTTPVLNGTFTILKNLTNNYKCSISIAYSRLGNNQFNDYPITWNEQPFCDMMKGSYRDYQYLFLNHSNLPQVPETGLCPFPAGTYWFKNAVFTSNFVPKFLP
ncbi:uncharacterized protein LOC129729240 [Wyeomyia smithii]|uniref:uncharacterized protein LOC129729240 n=1 Tax=Wyeomyia smithii TaxID=174621 RepID=UPI002467FB37|nr:uncharacterized protein LOC129729240 [Wyeomyia smithii]